MNNWEIVTLDSIVDVTMGQSPKSKFYNEIGEGLPFLQGNRTFGDKYPSFEMYTSVVTKKALKNEVLMSVRAPVGDLNIAPEDICIGRGVCSLKIKKGDNEFLYYLLKANISKLLNRESGTVFGSVNKRDIETLEVAIPKDLKVQSKILKILKNIDEKILINKQLNQNLENQIQTLFNSYFIDFDGYNKSDMVDSNLGFIPKDWSIVKLKDLVIKNNDKIKEFDDWKDELLIDLANMPRFSMSLCNFDKGKKLNSNIYKLNTFDLLFGSIRPYFGKAGFSPIEGVRAGTILSFIPKNDIYYSFLLSLICSKTFINYTVSVSKGTKMPSVKWKDFIDYEVVIPNDENIMKKFNDLVLSLVFKIQKNIIEIKKLTDLRDILLPKLMSGEIDVSNVEI